MKYSISQSSKILLSIIFFFSLFLLIVLSLLIGHDVFRSVDYRSMIYLQGLLPPALDIPFALISYIGSSELTFLVILVLFLYLLIRRKRLFLGLLLYFSLFIFELFGKLFIYHPKPPLILAKAPIKFSLPSGFFVHTEFSYPSGHAARIMFVVMVFLFILPWFIKNGKTRFIANIFLFGFIILVIISRVYLGEHWLSDVLGGLFLGSTIGSLSLLFL